MLKDYEIWNHMKKFCKDYIKENELEELEFILRDFLAELEDLLLGKENRP